MNHMMPVECEHADQALAAMEDLLRSALRRSGAASDAGPRRAARQRVPAGRVPGSTVGEWDWRAYNVLHGWVQSVPRG